MYKYSTKNKLYKKNIIDKGAVEGLLINIQYNNIK